MIRIDENTYIDDTLVTCAEYQLFIDEMREQGKYYQPDHWTSYKFPAGQARAPIVGVRFDDAEIFCSWLTIREAGEWSFRLPTSAEAKKMPLSEPIQVPLGYWAEGSDNKAEFAWVGTVPDNPRNISSELLKNLHELELDLDHIRDRAPDPYRDLDRVLSRDLARARTLALDRASARALDLDCDLARDLARASAIERDRDFYLDVYIDIYTLQERIAGRSPAFEGIRLVKERKP
jgi:hypothetical protein